MNTERKSFWIDVIPIQLCALPYCTILCISNNTPLDYVAKVVSEHCEHLISRMGAAGRSKGRYNRFKTGYSPGIISMFSRALSAITSPSRKKGAGRLKRIVI